MLYTEGFIFLHYPKAAGKTLTRFFIQAWENMPVRGSISKGQLRDIKDLMNDRVELKLGRGHENIRQSLDIYANSEFKSTPLKAVFVCIRNPYDHAVSKYFYERSKFKWNKDKENFQLAHDNPFKEYWKKLKPWSPASFFLKNGKSASRDLYFIQFENLSKELEKLCSQFGFELPPLDHLNAGDRRSYKEYYDQEIEQLIYDRYRFFFESGYYSRENFN